MTAGLACVAVYLAVGALIGVSYSVTLAGAIRNLALFDLGAAAVVGALFGVPLVIFALAAAGILFVADWRKQWRLG